MKYAQERCAMDLVLYIKLYKKVNAVRRELGLPEIEWDSIKPEPLEFEINRRNAAGSYVKAPDDLFP
jgi:hypothetical protein